MQACSACLCKALIRTSRHRVAAVAIPTKRLRSRADEPHIQRNHDDVWLRKDTAWLLDAIRGEDAPVSIVFVSASHYNRSRCIDEADQL